MALVKSHNAWSQGKVIQVGVTLIARERRAERFQAKKEMLT